MKIKGNVVIILISLATASVFISGGYGYWQKELMIKGDITVVKPVPVVTMPLLGQQVPLVPNALSIVGKELPLDPNGLPVVEEQLPNAPNSKPLVEEQLPTAPVNSEADILNPRQPEQPLLSQQAVPIEPINQKDKEEPIAQVKKPMQPQVEEPMQPELSQPEQTQPSQQGDPIEPINEQSPTNQPQGSVGDENNAAN
ncbi:MAG: hypothetical protein AB7E31_14600 [Desulfitobacterium sp.]